MIIGIAGPARAGKNEAANVLKQKLGFHEFSFASPMRNLVMDLMGISSLEELDVVKELPCELFGGKSPRKFLQLLGTEFGRNMISESVWVDACIQKAMRYKNSVISDVRFNNEAEAIINQGGKIIRVLRPQGKTIEENSHSSEAGIDDRLISVNVINDSTLANYHLQIYKIVKGFEYK